MIFKHFKTKISDSEKQKFYIAAYNAGEGTIFDAWKENGKKDCTWDDLIDGEKEDSPLWKAIPISWGKEAKYYEITEYVSVILKRIQ